jgi:hypothetical protein
MRKFILGCAFLLMALAAQPTVAQTADTALTVAQQSAYDVAVESFRNHRYAAAYGRFMKLADAGHVPSAQLALVMYRNGPVLFASLWDATPEQVERWTTLVVLGESGLGSVALAK